MVISEPTLVRDTVKPQVTVPIVHKKNGQTMKTASSGKSSSAILISEPTLVRDTVKPQATVPIVLHNYGQTMKTLSIGKSSSVGQRRFPNKPLTPFSNNITVETQRRYPRCTKPLPPTPANASASSASEIPLPPPSMKAKEVEGRIMFIGLHIKISLEPQVITGPLAEIRSIKLRKVNQETIPQPPTSTSICKESVKVEKDGNVKLNIAPDTSVCQVPPPPQPPVSEPIQLKKQVNERVAAAKPKEPSMNDMLRQHLQQRRAQMLID